MYIMVCVYFHYLIFANLTLLLIFWCAGLSDAMSGHIPQFVAHCICGNDLLKMSKQQLDYLMVSKEREGGRGEREWEREGEGEREREREGGRENHIDYMLSLFTLFTIMLLSTREVGIKG